MVTKKTRVQALKEIRDQDITPEEVKEICKEVENQVNQKEDTK